MKCDKCLFSRLVVSENGYHPVCTLSVREATKCLTGAKDNYISVQSCIERKNNE